MSDQKEDKEERILHVMRSVLIDVIKDTTTEPGLKHPLKDTTIESIRNGLDLITARQRELAEDKGEEWNMRPSYPAEPQQRTPDGEGVVVSIDSLKNKLTPKTED